MIFFSIFFLCIVMPMVATEFPSFPFLNVQWTASLRNNQDLYRSLTVAIVNAIVYSCYYLPSLLCVCPHVMWTAADNMQKHGHTYIHKHCYQHHINCIQFISIISGLWCILQCFEKKTAPHRSPDSSINAFVFIQIVQFKCKVILFEGLETSSKNNC